MVDAENYAGKWVMTARGRRLNGGLVCSRPEPPKEPMGRAAAERGIRLVCLLEPKGIADEMPKD